MITLHFIFRVLVRLGELDSRTDNICASGAAACTEPQDFQIDSIIHHNGYDTPKYANDIALIRLHRTINSSKFTKHNSLTMLTTFF